MFYFDIKDGWQNYILLKKYKKLLNQANEYYENYKERLQKQARNKYGELSNEEKDMKREYGRNTYQNILEENKKRLNEYHKNYHKAKKITAIQK